MALPAWLFEMALTTDPLSATPAWMTVGKVRSVKTVGAHRSAALDRFEAGVATVQIGNLTRAFEPLFAASPNYPNVKIRKRGRLRAQNATTTYPVISFYLESVQPTYPLKGYKGDALLTFVGSDAFRLFAGIPLLAPYPATVLGYVPSVYYRLNEAPAGGSNGVGVPAPATWADASGKGNNGVSNVFYGNAGIGRGSDVAINAPSSTTDGDGAIVMTGPGGTPPSAYVAPPLSTAITGQGAFAVAINCAFTATGFYGRYLCAQWAANPSGGVGTGWYLYVGTTIFFVCQDATNGVTLNTGINPHDTNWHYILAGRDGAGHHYCFVDGVQQGGTLTLTPANLVSAPIGLGVVPSLPVPSGSFQDTVCLDEFALFPGVTPTLAMAQALYSARTNWAGQSSDTRVGLILSAMGWAAGDRDIDAGIATLTDAADLAGQKALDHLRLVDATEGGCLVMNRAGSVMMRNRRSLQTGAARNTTSQATFGDGVGPNLLSANQSSMETDASGWVARLNCTLARSNAVPAFAGSFELAVTRVALGSAEAGTTATVAVGPSSTWTATMQVRDDSGVAVVPAIEWFDSGGALIGSTTYGPGVVSVGQWSPASVTGVAPPTAAFAAAAANVGSGAAGAAFYVDAATLATVEIGWSDITLTFDDIELANSVTITRRNGIVAVALDQAQIIAGGTVQDRALSSISNSDADAQGQAQWLLALLKTTNRWRCEKVVVPLTNVTAQQDAVLGREIWDRITVAFTPPGGGGRISQDVIIIGIDHSCVAGHWEVTFHTTGTDLQLKPFILSTSTLDSTDVLVW